MSCKLHHPFTAVVAGPTGCGKSAWVLRLIENSREMIDPPPSRIHYCYEKYQQIFNKYTQVQFHEGLPELSNEVFNEREPTLMIVDDLMSETNQLEADIFTKLSHHRNISILYLSQNVFDKNKYVRTITLNAHYSYSLKTQGMPVNLRFLRDKCIQTHPSLPWRLMRTLQGFCTVTYWST